MKDLPAQLRSRLLKPPSRIHTEGEARPAAVLIPLYRDQNQWHLLFTRRTENVESHRGQVSFPGGVIEAHDDNPAQAALREAEEEIGLHQDDVQIIGSLEPMRTVTKFIISPVVGVIPWPYPLHLNRDEVASAFGVPLTWLANPDNHEKRLWEPSLPDFEVSVHYFKPYQGEVIWGATARITLNLIDILQELEK